MPGLNRRGLPVVSGELLKRLKHLPHDPSPPQAARLVRTFGPAAPWFLTAAVLQRARQDERRGCAAGPHANEGALPEDLGSCWPLFRLEADCRSPVVRPAVTLPLQWVAGATDSSLLPLALRQAAEEVRSDLAEDADVGQQTWGLCGHPRLALDRVDFQTLAVTCASAWTALAAGLLVAARGGLMKTEIFLSAAWNRAMGGGFRSVDGLPEKLAETGQRGGRLFFLAAADYEEHAASNAPALELVPLPAGPDKPFRALRGILGRVQVRPGREAPFPVRCAFASTFPNQARGARESYLLSTVVEENAARLAGSEALGQARCDTLLLLVSSPSAALLSILAIRPARAGIFYTKTFKEDVRGVVADAIARSPWPRLPEYVELDDAEDWAGMAAGMDKLLEGGLCWVDVTGGTAGMSVMAAAFAAQRGAVVFQLVSDTEASHKAGAERILFLPLPPGARSV